MNTFPAPVLQALSESFPSPLFSVDPSLITLLQQNTSEFAPRNVIGVFAPPDVEGVAEVIRAAGKYNFSVYPYSTGKNWGLGSKLPVADDCALLELNRLNIIREVHEDMHFAIIEPGVTQRQLSDFLKEHHPLLMLNVTGSSPDSSIIGNILERGSGFYKHRIEDLRGLEVVKADGEILRTGFWHYDRGERPVHHYKYGIGPYIDGLFSQSNLGIVTAAVVNLIPMPESMELMWCSFHSEQLVPMIDRLSKLYKQNLLHNILHIGNTTRLKITGAEEAVWSIWGAISGTKNLVNFLKEEITLHLEDIAGKIEFLTDENVDQDNHFRTLYEMYRGVPSDMFLKAMYQSVGQTIQEDELNLDTGRYGMLCCLPMLPMAGKDINDAITLLHKVCDEFGIAPAMTINPISGEYAEAVINLYFDRSSKDATDNAHRCNAALHEQMFADGFRFYRIDVENMNTITRDNSVFWKTIKDIKKALDPQGIIAPGRYGLL
ncbi:MAG: FAD-binding oxidoreductase [Bacteroidota bacterium]